MLNAYTLHQLSVFVRIIEMGSLSKAARELGLSRSAVSKSLATLEQQLGVLLIKRSTRRLFLTEQGTAVFNRAIMLLDACQDLFTQLHSETEPEGVLRLSCSVAMVRPVYLMRSAPINASSRASGSMSISTMS
ncbi:LysR family transcriptional regulator [Edwardsiella tarda]|uniref:LysR family transcriptional regulator n=1 Tax=Edwardsiella tarda TaxID=636 RepID=UPI0020A3A63B|nr:LysR family transcriptional regulator [Edwardsiella tarda]